MQTNQFIDFFGNIYKYICQQYSWDGNSPAKNYFDETTFFRRKYKGSSLGTAIPIPQTLPKAFPELHTFSSSAGKGQGEFYANFLLTKQGQSETSSVWFQLEEPHYCTIWLHMKTETLKGELARQDSESFWKALANHSCNLILKKKNHSYLKPKVVTDEKQTLEEELPAKSQHLLCTCFHLLQGFSCCQKRELW